MCFLLIGLYNTKEKYKSLAQESKSEIIDIIEGETSKTTEASADKKIDSIKKELDYKMKKSFIPVPKEARKKILAEVEKEVKDTTKFRTNSSFINYDFGKGESKIEKFAAFAKKHPNSKIDVALDSLGYNKNFTNRFLYTKAVNLYSFSESEESRAQFINQLLSSGSIALFILLPIFTLFLKLFYIRKKYTYVTHLIFVFHIQTLFFILFSIFYILKIVGANPQLWIFTILFLLYLFIALKQFYQQGYFKTIVKFLLLNLSYSIVASVGIIFVLLISFAVF